MPSSLVTRHAYTGPRVPGTRASLSSVLTGEEAETIRQKLADGWRGPVLLTWLQQLLQDRDERRQRERESERPQP
jgi:hypothetical protein